MLQRWTNHGKPWRRVDISCDIFKDIGWERYVDNGDIIFRKKNKIKQPMPWMQVSGIHP
jgi:hypothetical protein